MLFTNPTMRQSSLSLASAPVRHSSRLPPVSSVMTGCDVETSWVRSTPRNREASSRMIPAPPPRPAIGPRLERPRRSPTCEGSSGTFLRNMGTYPVSITPRAADFRGCALQPALRLHTASVSMLLNHNG